jgi:hypothetical protein
MRTTLTIEDSIAATLKKASHQSGKSFKEVVNETLRAGLAAKRVRSAKAYKIKPVSLGGLRPGVDLNKALQLADALEDEEIFRKLELRK